MRGTDKMSSEDDDDLRPATGFLIVVPIGILLWALIVALLWSTCANGGSA